MFTLELCIIHNICSVSTFVSMYFCVSDGNMEDQELNEPQNRVALLKGENVMSYLHIVSVSRARFNI